jgi:hypothetical protein
MINGLMTDEGFKKLQKNTVDLHLAKCRNDTDLVKILTKERLSICEDEKNFVKEEGGIYEGV